MVRLGVIVVVSLLATSCGRDPVDIHVPQKGEKADFGRGELLVAVDAAAESPTIARDYRRLKKVTSSYIRNFVRLTGRIAQFTLCERLFSAWHVLHLPLFFMMVISALIHVLAVHMY